MKKGEKELTAFPHSYLLLVASSRCFVEDLRHEREQGEDRCCAESVNLWGSQKDSLRRRQGEYHGMFRPCIGFEIADVCGLEMVSTVFPNPPLFRLSRPLVFVPSAALLRFLVRYHSPSRFTHPLASTF